jgi:hypothetical protein
MIKLIEKTQQILEHNILSKKLEEFKQGLIFKEFDKNGYLQQCIRDIGNLNTENIQVNEIGGLDYLIPIDLSEVKSSTKDVHGYLEEYFNTKDVHFSKDDYYGYCIGCSTSDDCFINTRKGRGEYYIHCDGFKEEYNYDYKGRNELDLFFMLEIAMYYSGIYPSIVYTDYYGNFDSFYKVPEEYEFLRTMQDDKDKNRVELMWELHCLNHVDGDGYLDELSDSLKSLLIPELVQKIYTNQTKYGCLSEYFEITDFAIDDSFDISLTLKSNNTFNDNLSKALEKLNKDGYSINSYVEGDKYKSFVIDVTVNAKQFIINEINKE